MTYRVSWQDFRNFRTKFFDPIPDVQVEDFADKGDAEARKRVLIEDGMTACVTEVAPPRSKAKMFFGEPIAIGKRRFNKEWKTHR